MRTRGAPFKMAGSAALGPPKRDARKPKFTPGPWVIFTDRGIAAAVLPAMRVGEICEIDKWVAEDGVADANANLIAAAPELYATLEAVLRQWPLAFGHELQAAHAALAKARGE